jgi:uroporphyrinogen decarboxylase
MKPLLRALAGETLPVPPVWMMRQAGRYLPEYRAVRERAGGFLDLCYNPELAAEVTVQPLRRFGFDAAILFADILLVPQALGVELTFEAGEGPRLSTVTTKAEVGGLHAASAIHATLAPVYETVRLVKGALPPDVTLIGFAGAPWTVASYMIAGRGTPDQGPAHRLKDEAPEVFRLLIDLLTEATVEYLSAQVEAGAEVVKLFDSWAGSLRGQDFDDFSLAPLREITAALKARHPGVPVIAFPRGAGGALRGGAPGHGRGRRGARRWHRAGVGGGGGPARGLRAGQPRGAASGGRDRPRAGDAAGGRGVPGGTARLQPRARDHARRVHRQRPPHGRGSARLGPARQRRQAHQDGARVVARGEAELGAAVVDEVELGVEAAVDELALAVPSLQGVPTRRSANGSQAGRKASPMVRIRAKSASQSPVLWSSRKTPPTPRARPRWGTKKYSSAQAFMRGYAP